MQIVDSETPRLFFVDRLGGTEKTYLYRALLTNIKRRGMIVLATEKSGVAAVILSRRRNAHSRFGIPLQINDTSMKKMSK